VVKRASMRATIFTKTAKIANTESCVKIGIKRAQTQLWNPLI